MKSMEHKIRAEVVKLDLVNLQNNIVITTAVCWGRNGKHRLFGPAFSSDNAGDGPRITIIPKTMVRLGTKYPNLPITITVQERKIYFEAESVEGFCYNLKELEYNEKDQDSLLIGDGLSLVADRTAMRRVLNGNRKLRALTGGEKRERGPTSTITIVPSHIVFRGKKHPNYPITITLEGGAFYLESILIEGKTGR